MQKGRQANGREHVATRHLRRRLAHERDLVRDASVRGAGTQEATMTTGDELAQEIATALDEYAALDAKGFYELTDHDRIRKDQIVDSQDGWLRDLLTERSKKVEQIARLRLIIQCLEGKMDTQSRACAMLAYEAALKALEG